MSESREQLGRCFVISPIGQEGTEVRRHADEVFKHIISPAMKRCGLEPFRSDHLSAPGRISGQMFERILGDDLCIAVLTGHNPNVFYELAIAHFARKPVIIMLEKGKDLPFDVKDLRCVYYDFWPTPMLNGEYVDALVKQVEELRAASWNVPAVSPELERFDRAKERPTDLEFYERSADFGPDSRWLSLLEKANVSFFVMGVALLGWVRTKDFEPTLLTKANQGCDIRIMTLHEGNPSIDELDSSNKRVDESAELVRGQIRKSSEFFRSLVDTNPNVKFRQLRKRTPNFALTLTDQTALLVQYLHSLNWGLGPHLQCRPSSIFYKILKEEFDQLWKLAEDPE